MWLIIALFSSLPALLIGWVLTSTGYYLVLKKTGLRCGSCVIPFLAERELSTVLFSRMRNFYRSFIVAAFLMIGALYLGPSEDKGWIFTILAAIVYEVFLIRFYARLSKAFGKKGFFTLFLVLFPMIFLPVLGLDKSVFTPPQLKPVKQHGPFVDFIIKAGIVALSIAEILLLGYIVIREAFLTTLPSILVRRDLNETIRWLEEIEGNEDVIYREDYFDDSDLSEFVPSREHFYTDYEDAKSVVILSYVIGSDLEDKSGLASLNIDQMREATRQGDGIKFVMQAGGSGRWFTDGINDSSVGRYEIRGGKIALVEDVPDDTCMSEGETLSDFLKWAKDNYTADRYMLLFWDHGGGVFMGYGSDFLNKRADEGGTMPASEIISAIGDCGIKFDMIGFDACLMQDIEIAAALEPYTDYYLASEEIEGGYGWHYTSPFGRLAADPAMPTRDLAVLIQSSFDQLNAMVLDGEPDTMATLSLVDTTLAKPAYDKLGELMLRADKAINENKRDYADVAIAGNNAYSFEMDIQTDLVDFLGFLRDADFDDSIASDEEINDLINSVLASVVCRNMNSAEGIYGMAFSFPYKYLGGYTDTREELVAIGCENEYKLFDDVFSIMAAQRRKSMASEDYYTNVIIEALSTSTDAAGMINTYYENTLDGTAEEWYKEGYEDYDDTEALVGFPLAETDAGYVAQIDEKVWNIIADSTTNLFEMDEMGDMRYLGSSSLGINDEEGHPVFGMDGNWVYIGGELVCYDEEPVKKTEKGFVYNGKVRAKCSGDDVILYIEWDPVQNEGDRPLSGTIIGYDNQFTEAVGALLDSKGIAQLESGDTLQFIFNRYDEQGHLIGTVIEGRTVIVPSNGKPRVEYKPIKDGYYIIDGVFTDVYQRKMTSETVGFVVGY